MEFGMEKCAVLTMKKVKILNSDGIVLPNKTTMKGLKEGDSYKYLGVIQADGTKHHEMKEKVKTVLWMSEKDTRNETKWWNYNNRNKYTGNFITKILCCLSRSDTGRIRANGYENKKINDNASDIGS